MSLPTIIIRHKKENLKKCSLRGLEERKDFRFFTYPKLPELDLSNYVVLAIGAPILKEDDKDLGLLLVDATWRYSADILKQLPKVQRRGLPPNFKTAYPRRQTACPLPDEGLASIEALYVAYLITKRDESFLLENYHWKNLFLEKNKEIISSTLMR